MKAGKIESSVYLKLGGEPFDTYAIYEGALTYTVQTAGDTNPATGTSAPAAAFAAISLLAIAVLAHRLRS